MERREHLTALKFAERNRIPLENLEFIPDFAKWHYKSMTDCRVKESFGEHLPKIDDGAILDAGCSYGATTEELAFLYPNCKIVGLDREEDRLPRKLYHPELSSRVSFQKGNFYKLKDHFGPGIFNGIFVMNNLTHVASELGLLEHLLIAESFSYALSEGGYLCIAHNNLSAVLRKRGEEWKREYINERLRVQNYFGWLMEAYGIRTYPVGT